MKSWVFFQSGGKFTNPFHRLQEKQGWYNSLVEYLFPQAPLLRVVSDEKDEMLSIVKKFNVRLNDLGLDHEFIVLPDVGHNPPATFSALGDNGWTFTVKHSKK